MDTFRLSPDAVRRVMPHPVGEDIEPEETDRLVERVREVEGRQRPERTEDHDDD